ncbi:MAG TPA: DUF167 domain-containing protein [Thermoleophilaceae bacterium]|nr:DUF167 domain-containing protein [Thermoleophilaceae bacterium]
MPDTLLKVRVQPGSSRNEVAGRRDGAVVVRVTASPVDGKANKAACKLLAELCGIPASRVEIVRGETRRDKVVRLGGLGPGDAAMIFA